MGVVQSHFSIINFDNSRPSADTVSSKPPISKPQLNSDILRDVFHEIVKKDHFKNIDKFMLAGKEPFKVVLDCCKKANNVIICENRLNVQFPGIKYKKPIRHYQFENEPLIIGTEISTKMQLFKPISIALASSLKSVDIRGFAPSLIPMLQSIKHEVKEIYITAHPSHLDDIFKACINIPNVQNGVTIKRCYDIQLFSFPCHKLTVLDTQLSTFYDRSRGRLLCKKPCELPFLKIKDNNFYNSHLQNIRDLTIHGSFRKTPDLHQNLKEFAAFLSSNFQKLETLNVNFSCHRSNDEWDWNDYGIAEIFQQLHHGIKGCICFKIVKHGIYDIDLIKYPGLQKNGDEYYKIFPISDTLNFKMAYGN